MKNMAPIIHHIEQVTGESLKNYRLESIGGGCINTAYRIHAGSRSYFIKLNQARLISMFENEAHGLAEMRSLQCIRIPDVICYGQTSDQSYLVLEYIELESLRGHASQLLGTQLAQLHRHPQAFYGWHQDNTIGSTVQYNARHTDWSTFWQQERLLPQLSMAAQNGFKGRLQTKGQQLAEQVHVFFDNYTPPPALLHGDLWGGNAAADRQGNPVIFDPASYYGDRETDIAMTELFGGFGNDFYAAYQAEYPLDPAYQTRKTLYNLYHILNHVNLFGGSYLGQAETMIEQLLAEI